MTLYKHKYRVETTRLKGWDYSSNGYYFVTICTHNRDHLFGEIENGEMMLNEYGKIVEECWFDLPNHYDNLRLDTFVIMPNHIHGIMIIDNNTDTVIVETGFKPVSTTTPQTTPVPFARIQPIEMETGFKPVSTTTKRHGLFEFVRALKTFSARQINKNRNSIGESVWQSRFYDRIIRNETELSNIRHYVVHNPLKWENDKLNGGKGNIVLERKALHKEPTKR